LSAINFPELSAHTALALIHVACVLLNSQLQALESDILKEDGLRERMTRARIEARINKKKS
jgi:four helix bundle suffix protein